MCKTICKNWAGFTVFHKNAALQFPTPVIYFQAELNVVLDSKHNAKIKHV